MRGTYRGTFFGVPPTGKPIAVQAMNFYRLSGGQFVEERGQPDLLGLLQQIGATDRRAVLHLRGAHRSIRGESSSHEASIPNSSLRSPAIRCETLLLCGFGYELRNLGAGTNRLDKDDLSRVQVHPIRPVQFFAAFDQNVLGLFRVWIRLADDVEDIGQQRSGLGHYELVVLGHHRLSTDINVEVASRGLREPAGDRQFAGLVRRISDVKRSTGRDVARKVSAIPEYRAAIKIEGTRRVRD